MRPELTKALYDKYPELFIGKDMSTQHNLMPFGIECGDGWYDLVDKMCEDLSYLAKLESSDTIFVQIKQKFGGLRCYADYTHIQHIVIDYYERKSYHICEICGEPGQLRSGKSWLSTLCLKHAHENGYAISNYDAERMGVAKGEYVSKEDLKETANKINEVLK